MGIVNVTPDSFADGGRYASTQAAIAHGLRLAGEGADIVDVGGESTRPGAAAVPPEVEAERVVPVISALAAAGVTVSVDSRHGAVMRAAIRAGAAMLNDVSALCHDPDAVTAAAEFDGPVVLMHMRGTPADMTGRTDYPGGVVPAVRDWLAERLAYCVGHGIAAERLVVDPGIGFAKDAGQSLALLAALRDLVGLGRPVLVGASRKSFIGRVAGVPAAGNRLPGSLAAALWAAQQGADILRVHDVAETRQALLVWQALSAGGVDGDGTAATDRRSEGRKGSGALA